MPVVGDTYVEEEGGIKGAITRQIGPLPAWAWVGVIVGGYFLYRILRGGGSGNTTVTTSGSGGSTGGGSTGGDPLGGADAGNLISGLQSSVDDLQGQVGDLTGQVGDLSGQVNTDQGIIHGLTNLAGLQTSLEDKLRQKIDLNRLFSSQYNQLKTAQAALAKCTTQSCRTKYTGLANTYRTQAQGTQAQISSLDKDINSLEQQIQAAKPASTAQITAPSGANP